jgi:hypothetical protein
MQQKHALLHWQGLLTRSFSDAAISVEQLLAALYEDLILGSR